MEQTRLAKELKQKLKEENRRLRERLGDSATPTNVSGASPAGINSSGTPPPSPPSPPPLPLPTNDPSIINPLTPSYAINSSPPKYIPSLEFSSPGAEILNLRHQLTEAHLAIRKLEQKNSKAALDLSKVQGSLEAFQEIIDQLSNENQSFNGYVTQVHEERDGYKQELDACHERLEVIKSDVNVFLGRTYAQLMSLARELEEFKKPEVDDQEEHQDEERKRLGMLEKLRMAASIIRSLATSVVGATIEEDTEDNAFSGGNDFQTDNLYSSCLEDVQALEHRITLACRKMKEMEELLKEKDRQLEVRQNELLAISRAEEGMMSRRSEGMIEIMKKDLEIQYQVNLIDVPLLHAHVYFLHDRFVLF